MNSIEITLKFDNENSEVRVGDDLDYKFFKENFMYFHIII